MKKKNYQQLMIGNKKRKLKIKIKSFSTASKTSIKKSNRRIETVAGKLS
jgi:hypothetical protein